jgi:hypothetical protein
MGRGERLGWGVRSGWGKRSDWALGGVAGLGGKEFMIAKDNSGLRYSKHGCKRSSPVLCGVGSDTVSHTCLNGFTRGTAIAMVALKSQGYTVPDIAQVLKEEGFAAAPLTVHAALNRAAIALDTPNPYRRRPPHSDLHNSDLHNADASQPPAIELPTKCPLAEASALSLWIFRLAEQ